MEAGLHRPRPRGAPGPGVNRAGPAGILGGPMSARIRTAIAVLLLLGAACSSHPGGPPSGTYVAAMGANVLTLGGDDTWTLRSGIRTKSGDFRAEGDRIVFLHRAANDSPYSGAYCRGFRETYTWSLDAGALSFRLANPRRCDENLFAVLTVAGPWRPHP
jgi:hypothetical protein